MAAPVHAGDEALAFQTGGEARVAVRVGDRIAVVGFGPATPGPATTARLQQLADAAAREMLRSP